MIKLSAMIKSRVIGQMIWNDQGWDYCSNEQNVFYVVSSD